jgi:hypothetical protein
MAKNAKNGISTMKPNYALPQSTQVQYSFGVIPNQQSAPPPKLAQHSYNEFLLDLPEHWRQIPVAESNTLNFASEKDGAALIISTDFYEIPATIETALAEKCLSSRLNAHEQQFPGRVTVIRQSIKPHSGGSGFEMHYVADGGGEHLILYLGYVTSRKILNFTLVCKPDQMAAFALFNQMMGYFRPKLP